MLILFFIVLDTMPIVLKLTCLAGEYEYKYETAQAAVRNAEETDRAIDLANHQAITATMTSAAFVKRNANEHARAYEAERGIVRLMEFGPRMVALALTNLIKFERIVQESSQELGEDLAGSELVNRYHGVADDAWTHAAQRARDNFVTAPE